MRACLTFKTCTGVQAMPLAAFDLKLIQDNSGKGKFEWKLGLHICSFKISS